MLVYCLRGQRHQLFTQTGIHTIANIVSARSRKVKWSNLFLPLPTMRQGPLENFGASGSDTVRGQNYVRV